MKMIAVVPPMMTAEVFRGMSDDDLHAHIKHWRSALIDFDAMYADKREKGEEIPEDMATNSTIARAELSLAEREVFRRKQGSYGVSRDTGRSK